MTIAGLDDSGRREATGAGLELVPVSLQQLIVRLTSAERADFDAPEQKANRA